MNTAHLYPGARCPWTCAVLFALLWASFAQAAAPTAHAPQYGDRKLWPEDVEKTDYFKEKWEPARVLIWAHGAKAARGEEPSDAKNWLEDGKPASKPPDKNTDVVFPRGSIVGGIRGPAISVRHITIEPESRVALKDCEIHGNLWIKKGAQFSRQKGVFGGYDKSNFCRSDNDDVVQIPNMFTHNKKQGVSTEWIGQWQVGDEVNLFAGTMIIAPGSTFLPTDRRTHRVYPEAELVLHSGSTFEMRGNYYSDIDIEIKGKLLAGTKDRPLTSDATIGLSFKAENVGNKKGGAGARYGLVLHEEGSLIVNSADPKTARLVIDWHRRPSASFPLKEGEPAEVRAMPHGVTLVLLGQTELDGVEFRDVLPGGLLLAEARQRQAWKNITFGGGHAASPDALFASADKVNLPDKQWGRGRGNTGPDARR